MKSFFARIGLVGTLVWFVPISGGTFACRSSGAFVWAKDLPPSTTTPSNPVILRPSDRVYVVVRGQEALSGEFEVRPGGEVIVPAVGPVLASGATPQQLAARLRERLTGVLTDPQVLVTLASRKATISVLGEVKTQGQFDLGPGECLPQALARAGGLNQFANEDAIYVIRQKPAPLRVRFRYTDLVAGDTRSNGFVLEDGDVIVVE